MNYPQRTLTALFVGALLFTGCAKPPQDGLTNAQAALDAASDVEADLYVSDLYLAAADSFAAAQAEIEAQNAKNSFTRNYDRAEQLLAAAQQTATEAQSQVEMRKEALRVANDTLFADVDEALVTTQTLLAQAPKGKDGAVALVSIMDDSQTAAQMLNDARTAQAAGDYAEANTLAQTALQKANALIDELQTAIARTDATRS